MPGPTGHRSSLAALLLGAAWLLTGCGDPIESATDQSRSTLLSGKLVLTGSSTVAPLMTEIAKRFEELHPGVRVDVQTGGSSRGIADVRSGVADLGMASRELKDSEQDLKAFTLAQDGVCLIVHRDNPIDRLSAEQTAAIYTGKIRDWHEVGGEPGPITVVNKAEGRATLEVFLAQFDLESSDIRADIVIGDNQQGLKSVAGSPGAIAYVSLGAADYEAKRGLPIKLLAADDIAATLENLAVGRFPISRPLNLVTVGEPSGLAAELIRFAQSDLAHDLIEAQLFVPVAP